MELRPPSVHGVTSTSPASNASGQSIIAASSPATRATRALWLAASRRMQMPRTGTCSPSARSPASRPAWVSALKRALFGLFRGAVSKDVVSRAWRKVKVDWDAWCSRGLADEDIVRLILDGTVIKTRLDRKATNISVLAAIGVRRDGQKVLLSIGNMGGESQAAWRQFLDDLDARGLKRPGFVIVDGAPGLEAALSALWGDDLPVQRCTVHKHRNLLGHAPKHMHDELSEDYRDMIYADTASEVETRRKAFVRKWRLKCRAVADSLAEAGDKLFTFTRLSKSQWKSARTTNAIERLNEEFKRRIKTQTVLPCPETVPMLLWALLASGQIQMRKVDGWETLDQLIADETLDRAA